MENMNIIPQLYSELTVGHPDFINLAERCELLTQILLDCETAEQTRPVCRCLVVYLKALRGALDETMSEVRISELTTAAAQLAGGNWLNIDSETQCEYCDAVTRVLLHIHDPQDSQTLSGLLHDLVSVMTAELKAPRFL